MAGVVRIAAGRRRRRGISCAGGIRFAPKARKEAAAVAQNLLKVDASRVRKATAVQSRKIAAAPMGKAQGRAWLPLVPEQSSSGLISRVLEQRSLGYGAATPPRSFTDGGCFFNGSAGGFFDSAGQSPIAQPWTSQCSDPATWGNNATPPGGFTNLMQPNISQNVNLVGEPSQFAPFKPPRNMQDFQSQEEFSTPISARDNTFVNVDSCDEAPRTEKRIFWTQEEDVRMMSSWLLNSTDSSCGADRRNEQYWVDVEATYNETAPRHRSRNAKQIKDRFHKVNKWTDLFHSAWLKARMIYTSGYNDQMWIEKAHVFYIEDNKKLGLGPFVLMEVYNYGLGPFGNGNEGDAADHIDLDDLDEQPRPMGQKQAKRLKFAKSKEVDHIDLEELDKFSKLQEEQNTNRLKVLEVQQKLSSEKIEQTKLAHLAAKEQKEARKYELEARMFETFNHLLAMDLSLMSDEEKLDHANTLNCLKKKLFSEK